MPPLNSQSGPTTPHRQRCADRLKGTTPWPPIGQVVRRCLTAGAELLGCLGGGGGGGVGVGVGTLLKHPRRLSQCVSQSRFATSGALVTSAAPPAASADDVVIAGVVVVVVGDYAKHISQFPRPAVESSSMQAGEDSFLLPPPQKTNRTSSVPAHQGSPKPSWRGVLRFQS